jgi:pilus assembly protein CpaB
MTARRLSVALLFALVGAGLFTMWMSKAMSKAAPAAAPKQQYVAALHALEPGETLQKTNLSLVDWPASSKLDGGFQKLDDLVGRTVLYPLAAGEPILDRQLAAAGAGLGLSTKIPDGMRAISLKTDQVVGVAGFLLPGTHVDVLVTFRTPEQPDPVTSTVIQDAQVIAAGQKTQPDPEGKPTTVDVVTLLVKPNDAERVTLASAQGTVHFVLRNGSDHEQIADKPAELTQLGGVPKPVATHGPARKVDPPAAAPVAKTYSVHTVAGDKQTTEIFQ